MELLDILQMINQQGIAASAPADLEVGTVTRVSPLEITVNTSMAPLRAPVLYLTAGVVERKLTSLAHKHTVDGLGHTHEAEGTDTGEGLNGTYETNTELEQVLCLEQGTPLPAGGGYITLNRGLAVGDRVLLLRVMHGQKHIVLSRIYEGG
jgi:hypothetical protein